jgi:dTDP-glucose 4,6-dehydratase
MSWEKLHPGGRYLVTGGAGFIGSHLCEKILKAGGKVIAVDNLVTGNRQNIRTLLGNSQFEFVEHDLIVPRNWEGGLAGIFHFACPASPIDYAMLPIETLQVGSIGTENMLKLAREKNCPILIASTSEVYGDPLVHPQPESYWGNANPIGPRSCYDEAKRYSEAVTMAYRRTHGVQTRIIRIFNTYGPRMRPNDGRVVPNFCMQALRDEHITVYGTGAQTRSFCYVDDLVEGIVRVFGCDYGLPINLGNPSEMTIRQFAERIIALSGKKLSIIEQPLPPDDPKTRQPDIALAKKLLDWEPRFDLNHGLKETYAYFKQLHESGTLYPARSAPLAAVPASI